MAAKKHRDNQSPVQPPEGSQDAARSEAVSAPEAGGLSTEAMTRLRELGELHEQGVLTDDEFEREKSKVLGS
jgi:hypothetical protein